MELAVASALPQINMEAHRGPFIFMEDSGLIRGPVHFHVNLDEWKADCLCCTPRLAWKLESGRKIESAKDPLPLTC